MGLQNGWKKTTIANKAAVVLAGLSLLVSFGSAFFSFSQAKQNTRLEFQRLLSEDNAALPDLYLEWVPRSSEAESRIGKAVWINNRGRGDAYHVRLYDERSGLLLSAVPSIQAHVSSDHNYATPIKTASWTPGSPLRLTYDSPHGSMLTETVESDISQPVGGVSDVQVFFTRKSITIRHAFGFMEKEPDAGISIDLPSPGV